jgi:hypothetical protein
MVACVFFQMEDAIPRLDELRAWAGGQAKNFRVSWSRSYRGDYMAFCFKGDKARDAAHIFLTNCRSRDIPCWPNRES